MAYIEAQQLTRGSDRCEAIDKLFFILASLLWVKLPWQSHKPMRYNVIICRCANCQNSTAVSRSAEADGTLQPDDVTDESLDQSTEPSLGEKHKLSIAVIFE